MCLVCINLTKFLVRVSRTSFMDGELGSSLMGFRAVCVIGVERAGAECAGCPFPRNRTKPSDYYRQMCYKNVSNSNKSIPLSMVMR